MGSKDEILRLLTHCYASHIFRNISRNTQLQLLPGLVLTPTNFQHLTNRLSQPRTKLYCSEIS
ncbi:hypothetical protein T02_5898 [Trichinella nativa]|uniref:Uncharacterized protein n=1 Tax=Trichinella nativa TaxID=6335 RepID=A0A0V1KL87_9BILA|nr:hypothetical protein T06_2083 [Trichinella sp. T6]KRZ47772.1 hypothetical protein T02_5898 [Trichinella nativa]